MLIKLLSFIFITLLLCSLTSSLWWLTLQPFACQSCISLTAIAGGFSHLWFFTFFIISVILTITCCLKFNRTFRILLGINNSQCFLPFNVRWLLFSILSIPSLPPCLSSHSCQSPTIQATFRPPTFLWLLIRALVRFLCNIVYRTYVEVLCKKLVNH